MFPQTANNSPFPLQTKVTTRRKITYTFLKKKKINTCFTATSIKPSGAVTPARTKYVKTRASLARFICARVAHCFTFSTGSVVVQWLTEVQELVIDVNISDAASKMFVEDWEYNWLLHEPTEKKRACQIQGAKEKKKDHSVTICSSLFIPNTKTFHTRF